jgi:hypothetical protein
MLLTNQHNLQFITPDWEYEKQCKFTISHKSTIESRNFYVNF